MEFKFRWDEVKDAKLRQERELSFTYVVEASETNSIIADFQNPGLGREHQRIILIDVRGYIVAVPYVTDGNRKFLKTMYFDRNYNEIFGVRNEQ